MPRAKGMFFQNYLNQPNSKVGYNLLSILLFPFALMYGLTMCLRRRFYQCGILKSVKLNHPVISVGNITTGGTGKTPFEIYLIGLCREMGLKPLLLSRGYGTNSSRPQVVNGNGQTEIANLPDELAMLSSHYPDLSLAFGADRISAYNQALQSDKFDIVILDDGFQHLKIKRDLDIVILDAVNPLGAGRVLPSGNLREFKSALKNSDFTVINYKFTKPAEPKIKHDLKAVFAVSDIIDLKNGQPVQPGALSGQICGLLTAIGDPASFRRSLANLKIDIGQEFVFRDHHNFTSADLDGARRACESSGITTLLTTEKDAVKLAKISFEKPDIYVIKIHLKPVTDDRLLKQRIEALAQGIKKS